MRLLPICSICAPCTILAEAGNDDEWLTQLPDSVSFGIWCRYWGERVPGRLKITQRGSWNPTRGRPTEVAGKH